MTKWRRALAHVANYCIENRMKTPLGKPMDTFNKIGGELLRLAKEAMMTSSATVKSSSSSRGTASSAREKSSKDEEDGLDIGEPRVISAAEEWWRVRCLLEFVEILEKLMYYVNNGTMFPICNVSVVIRFGASALIDLEKKQAKAESMLAEGEATPPATSQTMATLCWMARSMAELGAEQAVHGLSIWVRRIYHMDMPFLGAIAEIAAARYERSLILLRKCIEDETLSDTLRGMLRDIRIDVLSRLRHPLFLDALNCPSEFSLWNEADKLDGQMPSGIDMESFTR
ncbi:unnamed protein product [Strongylus vulgaris]|uniref:Uncharacterized protein n=1 Tax=Strongylus vulgaris TaxID=40348 RepID=A0A3P7HZ26_STRVU|nr:unnamed protein product [Strongylus vulgaris]